MPTPDERKQVADKAIAEIAHIATLPEITMKIIELVEDPTSTAQDLHKVISQDPALSSRILKVVNSSFYGLPGQIASINRAIVMLGLNAVKNIAIAASLVKLFRGGELTPQYSAQMMWEHATAVAATCKMISDKLKLGLNDEAYLAGLMHNIGQVVEMQFDRAMLVDAIRQTGIDAHGVPANDMLEAEDAVYGANHQDFGEALCHRWKFPKSFAHVAGYHHHPLELSAENRTLTSVIYVATRIVGRSEGGIRADLTTLDYHPEVLEGLKINGEGLTALQDQYESIIKTSEDMAA